MSTIQRQSTRASTEAVFSFLRTIPWWGVIIAIVGLIVAYSVLTDVKYREAIYFILDLPWDKALVEEIPLEGEVWAHTVSENLPLESGTYHLYAVFYDATAVTQEDTVLRAEPDAGSAEAARLSKGEPAKFIRWHIVPKQGLQMEQRWVRVVTDDGRVGWALDKQFGQPDLVEVAQSGTYVLRVPKGAEPVAADPITGPADGEILVETSTPAISGEVLGGSWARIYDRFSWIETVARIWSAKGIMLTVRATILGYGLALLLGLIAGLMLVSRSPITLAISKLYVEVIRGIPLLVIVLYAGFVLSPYIREATNGGVDLRGFPGAVIGLGFGYGAYLAEVFRAGIQSIHRGQMEAARSLGMSYFQSMRHVILPQALRVVLPPLGNDFIAMLKDSSLISVVALPEILQQGRLWVSRTFRAFEGYNTVALFYLVMTLVLSLVVRVIERKTALPGRSEA
ncbi:MAG: ABC transporter permease subunit [Anaerolineae bacterium]|jgi:His/Glu/Gln/Arg/opine family amino acid ABC transporter permease subunit